MFDLKFALLFSIAAGIWKDMFAINVFGIHAILSVLWCLAVTACSRKISADNRAVRTFILGAVIVCNAAALRLLYSSGAFVPMGISLRIIAIETAYTALFFALCFDPIAKIVLLHKDKGEFDLEGDNEAGLEPDRDGLLY